MILVHPEEALPQIGTYNPPRFGRAYYFSHSGEKLRHLRKFTIDMESRNKNHDDLPVGFEKCTKTYHQVSAKGTTYSFFWLCALHHHCFGFHIIPGSEGRKDPFASLYTHLESPPDNVFYDFACSLQEYTLNRESGYFSKVSFFHDIFHGYLYKCSKVFKSSRLLGFESMNSEVCEQFNSFIKCIKRSVSQMKQVHFVF